MPFGVNWMSAEWPSSEIWPSLPGSSGERSFVTCGKLSRATTAWLTTARKAGSSAVLSVDWTSTYSDCSPSGNPPSRMM